MKMMKQLGDDKATKSLHSARIGRKGFSSGPNFGPRLQPSPKLNLAKEGVRNIRRAKIGALLQIMPGAVPYTQIMRAKVERSGLFDPAYYLQRSPDSIPAEIDLINHYFCASKSRP